ncbi:MAG: hypothetical protein M5U31_10325 [Acidimicrobiia bacterium]|nr:hypothetical protein [Acidimicrobiia bacterium]
MRIIHERPDRRERATAVTIGAYDGVHLGHRAVLRLLRELADARGLDAALVTFHRHPMQVVRPESAPKLLTTLPQKLELLESTGLLDVCRVLRFDDTRRHESAEDFVTEVLVGELRSADRRRRRGLPLRLRPVGRRVAARAYGGRSRFRGRRARAGVTRLGDVGGRGQ